MDVNNFSLQDSYMQIPPVTRAWLTGVVAVTVGSRFGVVPLANLALDLGLVFKRLQLWRLVTSFFFLGPLDLSWLINLFMMCARGGGGGGSVFLFCVRGARQAPHSAAHPFAFPPATHLLPPLRPQLQTQRGL
jgi:hypothetical protein